MTYYDDIYDHAIEEYYLITTKEANEIGVPTIEIVKLAKRGRLEHLGNGLYRLSRFVPEEEDPYAIAVKRIGGDAILYGESVLALLSLCPTNPSKIFVGTSRRIRKKLPDDLVIMRLSPNSRHVLYKGIPCQPVSEAIVSCKESIMPERLVTAASQAFEQGYLTPTEFEETKRRLSC